MKPILASYKIEIFCFLLTLFSVTGIWQRSLDLQVREKGINDYSIMKLEKPSNADSLKCTLQAIDNTPGAKELVRKNLMVDYFFMPGIYLAVAMWLLLIRKDKVKWAIRLLTGVAILQLVAWGLDINENNHLLAAVKSTDYILPGISLELFKLLVTMKFVIVYSGIGLALLTCVFKRFVRA